MVRSHLAAAVVAVAGGLSLVPASPAHAVCTLIISVDQACPTGCNETLKVSGFGYGVPHVLRICT